jgi:hypothetical protein
MSPHSPLLAFDHIVASMLLTLPKCIMLAAGQQNHKRLYQQGKNISSSPSLPVAHLGPPLYRGLKRFFSPDTPSPVCHAMLNSTDAYQSFAFLS